jgi:hypothetical protein
MTTLAFLLQLLVSASPVLACAVCGAGLEEENTNAFLKGTALLSLMPLGVIGGTAYYIYRRTKAVDGEAQTEAAPVELTSR